MMIQPKMIVVWSKKICSEVCIPKVLKSCCLRWAVFDKYIIQRPLEKQSCYALYFHHIATCNETLPLSLGDTVLVQRATKRTVKAGRMLLISWFSRYSCLSSNTRYMYVNNACVCFCASNTQMSLNVFLTMFGYFLFVFFKHFTIHWSKLRNSLHTCIYFLLLFNSLQCFCIELLITCRTPLSKLFKKQNQKHFCLSVFSENCHLWWFPEFFLLQKELSRNLPC